MRKFLLLTTALVCIGMAPAPAQADPITGAITGWLTTTFGATLGGVIAQLGGSILLSQLSMALAGKPKQEAQRAELHRPTALPAYRYVYGRCWAPGTPVGWHVVGDILYICYLLNSRASALTDYTVLFDKRAVTASGDPFNFAGGGAVASNEPFSGHLRYWIGRGSQTTCPAQIVSETGGKFVATDAWRGRTVLWARMDCGDQDERSDRWPATPPELNVDGDWSLVHDPRDGVTRHTRNQALIVRDALRTNPIRPYADAYLWDETFGWGADVAAQAVAVKAGGTIPRYRCDGVLVWADGSELEDQISPLLAAGASRLIRVGGRLGFVPAIARDPVHVITDFTEGQPLELTRWQPSDSLYTEGVGRYTAPDRAYESAETPAFIAPGAVVADGGLAKRMDVQLDFVTDHRQGQRVVKIEVMRSRMQRTVSGELMPDAFRLVAGSVATVTLPAPMTPFNGLYEVETIHPAAGINDDHSITLRLPVVLRETSAAIYAWNAATEEKEVEGASFDGSITRVQRPASVAVVSGAAAALISGGNVTVRVEASWPASTSASAQGYQVQYRTRNPAAAPPLNAWGDWLDGGSVDRAASDGTTYRSWIAQAVNGNQYQVRVRTVGLYGKSTWMESGIVTASGPAAVLLTPSIRTATGGSGRVDLVIDQSNDAATTRVEIWRATVNDSASATMITVRNGGPNAVVSYANTGLSAGTYYYWARSRDGLGNASPYSPVKSAIVT
ncbi:phage tail protein [Gemmobacter serpentinus]|uniref:hypothetical protein n=1 Tax=Gemmobacter serpentinus TaxID=2652247 RepID=UPI00124F1F6B|nr:hypothetical protein [Gemmobacter serpentinus]